MKKQILFVALFIMALISGTTNVFAQLTPGITATQPLPPLLCAANASPLHPLAGQSYTYQMNGSAGAETANMWTWFATKDPSFISTANGTTTLNTANMLTTASGALLGTSLNYGNPTAGANTVNITWSPAVIAGTGYQGAPLPKTPTFVVGYATGQNCSDNIQVYEINPIVNFTVDIANINATGNTLNWDTPTSQCVDVVRGASYNATNHEIDVNYGTNTLYFEVAAANFNTNFTPTFTLISGLNTVQSAVVTLHNTYAEAVAGTLAYNGASTTWTTANIGVGNGWATNHQFTAADPANIASGVSLFVKVVITNSTEETLIANPFVLAVDARDGNNTGIWDMEDEDCTYSALLDVADQVDRATHTINPRPQLDNSTVDAGAPNPTRWIPKTPVPGGF